MGYMWRGRHLRFAWSAASTAYAVEAEAAVVSRQGPWKAAGGRSRLNWRLALMSWVDGRRRVRVTAQLRLRLQLGLKCGLRGGCLRLFWGLRTRQSGLRLRWRQEAGLCVAGLGTAGLGGAGGRGIGPGLHLRMGHRLGLGERLLCNRWQEQRGLSAALLALLLTSL